MKLGLKTLALALVVALLAVPAAFAKGGHGHGKPSWAGASHAKPLWAGKGHEKKAKHDKKNHKAGDAALPDAGQPADLNLNDLNPAWYCKTLALMHPDSFSSLATNANGANAFGKCVSARAQGQDVAGQLGDQPQQSCDQPPADGSGDQGSTGDGSGDGTTTGSDGTTTGSDGTTTGSDGTTTGSDGTTTGSDGTTTGSADEGTTTGSTGDGSSGDQADQSGGCQSGSADQGDQTSQDGQDDQAGQDDQGEDSNAQGDQNDQGDQSEAAAFAQALLSFVKL